MSKKMKTVYYKGFVIYQREHGWWDVFLDQSCFRFNELSYAKARIDFWTK